MRTETVAVIDGSGANIASLRFALARLGCESTLTTDTRVISGAARVILPGVGAARDGMDRLARNGLDDCIRELRQPVLGICLGLQLLCEASDEDDTECLGIVPGIARRFAAAPGRPVPHMGWNRIYRTHDTPLLNGVDDGAHCYFVHSYALDIGDATVAKSDYGRDFSAVLRQNNFCATQFHPERSGKTGARILENFLAMT